MIAGLLSFLYLIVGLGFAVLMVRFGGYNPGRRGEPSPLIVIIAWPIIVVVMAAMGCNDLINKMLASAKKEDNDSN